MTSWGIILAAGLGVRMGTPKAFLPLGGKPMLLYSLQAFQNARMIDRIGVVARREDQESVKNLCKTNAISKLSFVVPGGKERQDSVREGLSVLPADVGIVAIHDAARPMVTTDLIEAVVEKAGDKGAAAAACPIKDTVKRARDSQVFETLDRSLLWSAQTPQAFRLGMFKEALAKAYQDDFYGTDCAGVVEHFGKQVYLVEGSPENIKVTTPSDALMAEAILKTLHV